MVEFQENAVGFPCRSYEATSTESLACSAYWIMPTFSLIFMESNTIIQATHRHGEAYFKYSVP